MRRLVTAALAAALVVPAVLPAPALARKKAGTGSPMLPTGDYLPVTDEQAALGEVPFAPGARAVVLFEGAQHDWQLMSELSHRVTYHRRIKILTPAGVEELGDFTWQLFGDVRVKETAARTVRPDGTIIDCSADVKVERSQDKDYHEVRVAWPQVEPGAILDLRLSWISEDLGLSPWVVQHRIPLLESRLVVTPLGQMRYRTAALGLTAEQAAPTEYRRVGGTSFYWDVEDVPALPAVPFMPPEGEIAAQVLLIVESIDIGTYRAPYAPDWPTFAKERGKDWKQWQKQRSGQAAQLARQTCEGAATPRDKAEAIRKALADRVRVDWDWWWPDADSPDAVLSAGHGRSADVAGLAASMLAAVGVPSRPAAFRPRDSGLLPPDAPLPSLLEDLMLEVRPAGGEPFWFVPTARVPAGTLPVWARGVNVVPFDDDVEGVVPTPELTPDENGIAMDADVTLDAAGRLEAQLVATARGEEAAAWRRRLRDLPADARRQRVQRELSAFVPTVRVEALEVEGLDDGSAPLILTCLLTAEGAAQVTSRRVLWNPNPWIRVAPEDWAATERTVPIDLGTPFRRESRVSLTLPEGTEAVNLPSAQVADGGDVGRYELAFDGKGRTIVVRRSLELRATRFPAATWKALREWFQVMAKADDQPLVITLAEAAP